MIPTEAGPVCVAEPGAKSGFTVRRQIATGCLACAAGAAFLFTVNPSHYAVYPQCLLYNTTGIYCVGCGATRALYALLHGQVLTALHDNVLFVALLPLLLWIAGKYLARAWLANAWPSLDLDSRQTLRVAVVLLPLVLAFAILRNLPGWPFELLRPL